LQLTPDHEPEQQATRWQEKGRWERIYWHTKHSCRLFPAFSS